MVSPVSYSQFEIMFFEPSTTVKIIIIDWITDFVLLLIALYLIKFDIKKEFKKILLASFIGLGGGLVADFLGFWGSMFGYYFLAFTIPIFTIFMNIPILMFLISFAALYVVYYLISEHLLKIDKKKTVAIFMAIFTNPLWLTLINASLFYPDYFQEQQKSYSSMLAVEDITNTYNNQAAYSICDDLCSKYEGAGTPADCSDVQAAVSFCLQKVNIDIDGNRLTGEKGHYNVVERIPLCEDGIYCFHLKNCRCSSMELDSATCLKILCYYYQNISSLSGVQVMAAIRNGISYGSCEPNILLWIIKDYIPVKISQSYHSDWTDKEITYMGPDYWWTKAGYNSNTC
jgi:hypothetical protein